MLQVNERIGIPDEELQFQYVRSSGPGGQNVNKVATKAVLRWDVTRTSSLPWGVRTRLMKQQANRINVDGILVLSSDEHRSQIRNTEACLERLRGMILEVLHPPKPRRPTKPSRSAKRRRMDEKRRLSNKKQRRRAVRDDD